MGGAQLLQPLLNSMPDLAAAVASNWFKGRKVGLLQGTFGLFGGYFGVTQVCRDYTRRCIGVYRAALCFRDETFSLPSRGTAKESGAPQAENPKNTNLWTLNSAISSHLNPKP